MKTVFLLPGQGSLYPGMLQELYANRKSLWPEWEWGEKVLAKHGIDAAKVWFNAPRSNSSILPTCVSHPATFVVHYCLGKMLERELGTPSAYLGYSLGEITSLALSGCIDPEESVDTLVRVGTCCDQTNADGGMVAIVDSQDIRDSYFPIFEESEIACYNYESHHVVAGLNHRLDRICQLLKSESILHERLAVQCPFHSHYMGASEFALKQFSLDGNIDRQQKPIYSSLLSRKYTSTDLTYDHIWQLHRYPVNFERAIQNIEQEISPVYVDVSSTGTLGTFAKQLLGRESQRIVSTFSPWGNDLKQLEKAKSQLYDLV